MTVPWGTSVEDCEHSGRRPTGRPETSVEKVRQALNEDRGSAILETAAG